jgi:LPS sulfotransferase NodH
MIAHEVAWQQFFVTEGIQPLVIVYEDLIEAYEITMRNALHYLHITIPEQMTFSLPFMQRQADALSEAWLQRYQELKYRQDKEDATQQVS